MKIIKLSGFLMGLLLVDMAAFFATPYPHPAYAFYPCGAIILWLRLNFCQ